jgi:hypothetical protein
MPAYCELIIKKEIRTVFLENQRAQITSARQEIDTYIKFEDFNDLSMHPRHRWHGICTSTVPPIYVNVQFNLYGSVKRVVGQSGGAAMLTILPPPL